MHYYYAQVIDGVVENTIVVDEIALLDEHGIEQDEIGVSFCQQFGSGQWIRTYLTGEKRKWYGAPGFTYRADTRKVFIKRASEEAEQQYALTSATQVAPGDTIRITERFF